MAQQLTGAIVRAASPLVPATAPLFLPQPLLFLPTTHWHGTQAHLQGTHHLSRARADLTRYEWCLMTIG